MIVLLIVLFLACVYCAVTDRPYPALVLLLLLAVLWLAHPVPIDWGR